MAIFNCQCGGNLKVVARTKRSENLKEKPLRNRQLNIALPLCAIKHEHQNNFDNL